MNEDGLPDYNHTEEQEYEEEMWLQHKKDLKALRKMLADRKSFFKLNLNEILAKQAEGGNHGKL